MSSKTHDQKYLYDEHQRAASRLEVSSSYAIKSAMSKRLAVTGAWHSNGPLVSFKSFGRDALAHNSLT